MEGLLKRPGGIGWRARLELAEWWATETHAAALADADKLVVEQQGCITQARLAGSSLGGSFLKLRSVHVGFRLELSTERGFIITRQ